MRIEGKIEGNHVALTAKGAPGRLMIYLNRDLAEVEKPVSVTLNGEAAFEGVVRARLSVLLDTIATGRDPNQYYDRCLTIPQK